MCLVTAGALSCTWVQCYLISRVPGHVVDGTLISGRRIAPHPSPFSSLPSCPFVGVQQMLLRTTSHPSQRVILSVPDGSQTWPPIRSLSTHSRLRQSKQSHPWTKSRPKKSLRHPLSQRSPLSFPLVAVDLDHNRPGATPMKPIAPTLKNVIHHNHRMLCLRPLPARTPAQLQSVLEPRKIPPTLPGGVDWVD